MKASLNNPHSNNTDFKLHGAINAYQEWLEACAPRAAGGAGGCELGDGKTNNLLPTDNGEWCRLMASRGSRK